MLLKIQGLGLHSGFEVKGIKVEGLTAQGLKFDTKVRLRGLRFVWFCVATPHRTVEGLLRLERAFETLEVRG